MRRLLLRWPAPKGGGRRSAEPPSADHRPRPADAGNNSAIAHRGVSLLQEVQAGFVTRLDTPPFSCRHHPGSAIAPKRRRRFTTTSWGRSAEFDCARGTMRLALLFRPRKAIE